MESYIDVCRISIFPFKILYYFKIKLAARQPHNKLRKYFFRITYWKDKEEGRRKKEEGCFELGFQSLYQNGQPLFCRGIDKFIRG